MISLCVCDDDVEICNKVAQMIISSSKSFGYEIWVDKFYSGEELQLSKNRYDIMFLDINMLKISGIDIGKTIRNTLNDEKTQLIYISSNTQYAMELFEVRPLNFLVKPIDEYKLAEVLLKAIHMVDMGLNMFSYESGRETRREEIRNIIYFESNNRIITIHTVDGTFEFYGKLKDIYDQLKYYKFFYSHKSYLINYNYVKTIGNEELVLTNKEKIVISQSKRKKVKELVWEFERNR